MLSSTLLAFTLVILANPFAASAFQAPHDVRQSQPGVPRSEASPHQGPLTAVEAKPNGTKDVVDISSSKNERKEKERRLDYEKRRRIWEERYGSVEALKRSFGDTTKWGDLDPESTRQLYHTLLPRSLLGLHEAGLMRPDELAPLAYQARVAAKEYARKRCTLPGRLLAMAYDGYRSFRRDGTFRTKGVSWEQLWDKYEAQIVEECVAELSEGTEIDKDTLDKDALTARIYLRILERSCATNQAFDKMFLKPSATEEFEDLDDIAEQLDRDVREILLHPKSAKKARKYTKKAEKQEEEVALKRREEEEKAEKKRLKEEKKKERAAEKARAKAEKAERKRLKAERKKAERQS